MAGIYIHIPFCKSRCCYCDFCSSTEITLKEKYISALLMETERQKKYLQHEPVETIYFGGGTPSLLSAGELNTICNAVFKNFTIATNPEITLEANPDDLSPEYTSQLKTTPVNRLSIGIQSFFDEDLNMMNRRHNARQATDSVKIAQKNGFDNISADLIYGLPGLTLKKWEQNLNSIFQLNIPHFSAYHLTLEKGTQMTDSVNSGKLKTTSEEQSVEQFNMLTSLTNQNGFIHYEISNFAKPGFFSRHNSSYWLQKNYLGLGASSHSYNSVSRQWNTCDLLKYITSAEQGVIPFEKETLNRSTKYNEYILTRLRTIWGADLKIMEQRFGKTFCENCLKQAQKYIDSGFLHISENSLILSDKGKFVSDRIIGELMME